MTINLKVEKRDKIGKLDNLRKQGYIPAVFYGRKQESTPIQIKKSEFIKTWRNAGESTVVKLEMGSESVEALIKNIDMDPVIHEPRHADFYVFEKGHMVEIAVPIEFEGTPKAVKELGGILVKVLHELQIKADPSNLPHEIIVDVSEMDALDSQILAHELKLPAGVTLIDDPKEVVASISVAREEVEEVKEVDLDSIEVEQKGKKDEESEEGASE